MFLIEFAVLRLERTVDALVQIFRSVGGLGQSSRTRTEGQPTRSTKGVDSHGRHRKTTRRVAQMRIVRHHIERCLCTGRERNRKTKGNKKKLRCSAQLCTTDRTSTNEKRQSLSIIMKRLS